MDDREFIDFLKNKYNINLNEQQKQAVLHKDGSMALISVPGSGKTTVIISRTANLIINHKINPKSILTLTFSRASAQDMKHRFTKTFGELCGVEAHFSTIHSFAYSVIRDFYRNRQMPLPTIIESNSDNDVKVTKTTILKQIYYDINGDYINDDKFDDLTNTINYIKNMLYRPQNNFNGMEIDVPKFKEIYIEYERQKRENNYMDFSDMVMGAYDILRKNANILNIYKSIYKYIQIDEAQDTSVLQNHIIRLLAYPEDNVFFAGDDDQCLYSMNGCTPATMLAYKKVYPNIKIQLMEKNYRSTAKIVEVANKFILKNKERFDKQLATDKEAGRDVTIISLKDDTEQYRYIADVLQKIENKKECALLYRANISAIPIADILDKNNIPFYIRDAKPHFFNHWVTEDIISFMKLIMNIQDLEAFEKIYYKLNSYITKKMLEYLKEQVNINNDTRNIFDILMDAPEVNVRHIKRFQKLKKVFASLQDKSAEFVINYIEFGFDYGGYLQRACQDIGYSIEYLNTILSTLKSISTGIETLPEILSRLTYLKEIIENSKNNKYKNAVTLSTLHSSKGLEFDNVFIVDMIEGCFPTYKAISEEKDNNLHLMEEERRLCYVGITRARKYVDIVNIEYKNKLKVMKSRFIFELESIIKSNTIVKKDTSINEFESFKLMEGITIKHKKFGEGIIVSIEKNIIIVIFKAHGQKKLLLQHCLEHKLIS
ncbi:MAG TPA: ATP-dependent helicase [Clostridiales bacterium]|nr:ATP-dependent helicase [Clostridiales bacterium]